jgi:hypothetical protein
LFHRLVYSPRDDPQTPPKYVGSWGAIGVSGSAVENDHAVAEAGSSETVAAHVNGHAANSSFTPISSVIGRGMNRLQAQSAAAPAQKGSELLANLPPTPA